MSSFIEQKTLLIGFYYRPQTKLWEGNVFTGDCLSVILSSLLYHLLLWSGIWWWQLKLKHVWFPSRLYASYCLECNFVTYVCCYLCKQRSSSISTGYKGRKYGASYYVTCEALGRTHAINNAWILHG